MAGITCYGAYIPVYRLERAEIGKAWGIPTMPGEKAVANYDEDAVTMAVAACLDCLGDMDRQQIDALFVATTSSPYLERQISSIVARAIDLRPDVLTADYVNSIRGGTLALNAALDAVDSGKAKQVLVVAADCRLGAAQSQREAGFGDGAGAVLVGKTDEIARVLGSHSVYDDTMDVWRTHEDRFVRSWEERFVIDKGYVRVVKDAASRVMADCGVSPKALTTAVLYAPDPRSQQNLAKALGFDPKTQLQDSYFASVGNTGAALTLMMLVGALEKAKAGDKLLVAGYGNGSDAFIMEVTEQAGKTQGRRGITGHLASKLMMKNYEAYARIRQLIAIEPIPRPPKLLDSAPGLFRNKKEVVALIGSKCNHCGKPQYPVQRVCSYCQTKDDFEPYRFSDKKATLYTYSIDMLGNAITDVPPVVSSVANFEGGGRTLCQMVDCDVATIKTGMPLEMTFRKLHQVEGVPFYYWKTRPVR